MKPENSPEQGVHNHAGKGKGGKGGGGKKGY